MGKRRRSRSDDERPELSLAQAKRRLALEPETAARIAVSRRAKPSAIPGYVRLLLTLEIRRELAEKLSLRASKTEENIGAIIVGLIETAAQRWR